MIGLDVHGMSCNHCVMSVTKAVKALDAQAEVKVDLAAGRVEVDSAVLDRARVAAAIEDAGYDVKG